MVKKLTKIVMVLLCLFAVSTLAILISNKTEAYSYFETMKIERETEISNALQSVVYTTDKLCEIDYDSEIPVCTACYEFRLICGNEIILGEGCAYLDEGSSTGEDGIKIISEIKEQISWRCPQTKVEYLVSETKGESIKVDFGN